jgi:hypothetical protein
MDQIIANLIELANKGHDASLPFFKCLLGLALGLMIWIAQSG